MSPARVVDTGMVLVVDDEPEIREVLVFFLKKFKLRVLATSNGREAIDAYESHASDIKLVISDMKMPEMSGVELAQQLRSAQGYEGGFFLITGGVNFGTDSIPEHVNGIISKPFSASQLQTVVNDWLENPQIK